MRVRSSMRVVRQSRRGFAKTSNVNIILDQVKPGDWSSNLN
jgi:hypothetical protein